MVNSFAKEEAKDIAFFLQYTLFSNWSSYSDIM